MVIEVKAHTHDLDVEWMLLILEAKKLGIKKEDVRNFLQQKKLQHN